MIKEILGETCCSSFRHNVLNHLQRMETEEGSSDKQWVDGDIFYKGWYQSTSQYDGDGQWRQYCKSPGDCGLDCEINKCPYCEVNLSKFPPPKVRKPDWENLRSYVGVVENLGKDICKSFYDQEFNGLETMSRKLITILKDKVLPEVKKIKEVERCKK